MQEDVSVMAVLSLTFQTEQKQHGCWRMANMGCSLQNTVPILILINICDDVN